jgi:hypothetical protein
MRTLSTTTTSSGPPATWRLYMLRAGYLLLVVGLGATIWPELLHHPEPWVRMRGIVVCMLAAMSALALLGLRYPLQMLPLLFFEIAWKSIWLLAIAAPAWAQHRMDVANIELENECLVAIVFLIVMPWDYVFQTYLRTIISHWNRSDRPTLNVPKTSGGGVIAH